MQALLMINSTEAYYSDVCTGRRLQRRRDGWPTSRQATHRAVGEEGMALTWTLMRNWDHGISYQSYRARRKKATIIRQWTMQRTWESGVGYWYVRNCGFRRLEQN